MKWFLGILGVVSLSAWLILEFVFPRPEGHWHVFFDSKYEVSGYETLDFEDNQITAGNNVYGYYGGGIDRFRKRLRAWPMCRGFEPHYHFSGDSLIMTEEGRRHYALNFDKEKCTKQSHFFSTSHLIVDLVEINDTLNFVRLQKLSLLNGIEVGEKKTNSTEKRVYPYGGDLEVTQENISLYLERHKISVVEEQQEKIQLAFYADKETKVKHLKPILQKLAAITDRPKVVLVFQYNPQPDAFELFGKEIMFEGVDWKEVDDELLFSDYVLGKNAVNEISKE